MVSLSEASSVRKQTRMELLVLPPRLSSSSRVSDELRQTTKVLCLHKPATTVWRKLSDWLHVHRAGGAR